MRGPIIDILVLLLLILFFGLQQRNRPELYFRFWLAGWILAFLSYGVWEFGFGNPVLTLCQKAVTFDLVLLGGLAFALSFEVNREHMWKMILLTLAIAVPACAGVNLQTFHALLPVWLKTMLGPVLMVLIVLGHVLGMITAKVSMPPEWRWQRVAVYTACVLFGALMLALVYQDPAFPLPDLILGEVFLCSGVLYAHAYGQRSRAGMFGAVGFAAWGGFYLAGLALLDYGHLHALKILWSLWNLPKYTVGFSMILRIFEDETEEKARLADKYRALYDDFRVMYEGHPHPMWIYEIGTRRILSANLAAMLDYGYSQQEFVGMTVQDLEAEKDTEVEWAESSIPESPDEKRLRFLRKNGSRISVNVADHAVQFQGVNSRLMVARDITERLKINHELAWRAHHDVLTGLPNRLLLDDRIQQTLAQCVRTDKKAALLSIDVDHFKLINDTYGHPVGDACLKAVAERMKGNIRQMDTLARTGGEEFTGIMGGLSSAADAERVATTLLRIFDVPIQLPDMELPITISIGVALFPDDAEDAETLRKMSDEALYHAKRTGRNRVAFAPAGAAEQAKTS